MVRRAGRGERAGRRGGKCLVVGVVIGGCNAPRDGLANLKGNLLDLLAPVKDPPSYTVACVAVGRRGDRSVVVSEAGISISMLLSQHA
jgi:hypothetical protein